MELGGAVISPRRERLPSMEILPQERDEAMEDFTFRARLGCCTLSQ